MPVVPVREPRPVSCGFSALSAVVSRPCQLWLLGPASCGFSALPAVVLAVPPRAPSLASVASSRHLRLGSAYTAALARSPPPTSCTRTFAHAYPHRWRERACTPSALMLTHDCKGGQRAVLRAGAVPLGRAAPSCTLCLRRCLRRCSLSS
eukprot:6187861-Pleurochrysis_carterae.AAC.2